MCIVKKAYICVYVYIVQYVHWIVADHMDSGRSYGFELSHRQCKRELNCLLVSVM